MMPRYWMVNLSVLLFGLLIGWQPGLASMNHGGNKADLQIRAMTVAPDTDEQTADWETSKPQTEFKASTDVTILVQVKNVSEKPVRFRGVRFGSNVSKPWPGRSRQDRFGPQVFLIDVFDKSGVPVEMPVAKNEGRLFTEPGTQTIEPGETVDMLIKPISWDESLASGLPSGTYQIQVNFVGGENLEGVKSEKLDFVVQKSHKERRHSLSWGEPANGIRVAAEYRLADTRAENPDEYRDRAFPIDSKINVRFHFQNTTGKPIEFSSPVFRQDDQTFWVKESGDVRLQGTWYSGITPQKTWTIQSKQIVVIPGIALGLAQELGQDDFPHTIGAVIRTEPGVVKIRHDLQGGYSTGISTLKLRARKDTDDPKKIDAFLRFKKPDGSFAKEGFVKVTSDQYRHPLFEGPLTGEKLQLNTWTGSELRVFARIPDCQEETFFFIQPDKDPVITLSSGATTTMRLVDSSGNPVAGAEVRQFAWTHEDSSGYPFPTNPTGGDILATSDDKGQVKLASLETANSKRAKIYTFYVSPGGGLAPCFVGPTKSGVDWGDVELAPLIEISGVIEGTKEELENFAAEWDQPVELILGNGNVSSLYANSKKLAVRRDGDKLTFRLSHLRPGKLRIIANFAERPHTISRTSGRRDAKGTDQLFEFDLSESRDDVVIKAKEK